ncbi:MAG: hypothetical protein JWM15_2074 [Cryptosporangiaceae bacterium]|nr:hypothetical protein [Cryptosporangiaceae bacterium]
MQTPAAAGQSWWGGRHSNPRPEDHEQPRTRRRGPLPATTASATPPRTPPFAALHGISDREPCREGHRAPPSAAISAGRQPSSASRSPFEHRRLGSHAGPWPPVRRAGPGRASRLGDEGGPAGPTFPPAHRPLLLRARARPTAPGSPASPPTPAAPVGWNREPTSPGRSPHATRQGGSRPFRGTEHDFHRSFTPRLGSGSSNLPVVLRSRRPRSCPARRCQAGNWRTRWSHTAASARPL